MKVLIPCEFSGIVRDAFIERGHDATSCDRCPVKGQVRIIRAMCSRCCASGGTW